MPKNALWQLLCKCYKEYCNYIIETRIKTEDLVFVMCTSKISAPWYNSKQSHTLLLRYPSSKHYFACLTIGASSKSTRGLIRPVSDITYFIPPALTSWWDLSSTKLRSTLFKKVTWSARIVHVAATCKMLRIAIKTGTHHSKVMIKIITIWFSSFVKKTLLISSEHRKYSEAFLITCDRIWQYYFKIHCQMFYSFSSPLLTSLFRCVL